VKTVKVTGRKKSHKVFMYAISTCVWCRRTKQYLKDNNIEYEYVDVDLCSDEDKDKIEQDLRKRGEQQVFPTIIVDDKVLITGYKVDKIARALGL
jgi:glutaredoxin